MGDNGWLVFIGLAIAGLIGLFLDGWMRRKESRPPESNR